MGQKDFGATFPSKGESSGSVSKNPSPKTPGSSRTESGTKTGVAQVDSGHTFPKKGMSSGGSVKDPTKC